MKIKFDNCQNWLIVTHPRKISFEKQPCRLEWINSIAKVVASCKSEHGWRANSSALNLNTGTCMGRGLGVQATKYITCVYMHHKMLAAIWFCTKRSQQMQDARRKIHI